jgi:hypothetical protein
VRILATAIACCLSATLLAESAAGLQWTAPAGWKAGPPRQMRAATYGVAAVAGDTAESECVVYFFGAGQGGSVDDNIDRWTGQFTTPSGKPATAIVGKRTAHGVAMTTIDVAGAYSGLGGPMAQSKSVPGYRLLGAIVEGPGGNIFVKFTGPSKTIAANKAKFDQLLASFTKG